MIKDTPKVTKGEVSFMLDLAMDGKNSQKLLHRVGSDRAGPSKSLDAQQRGNFVQVSLSGQTTLDSFDFRNTPCIMVHVEVRSFLVHQIRCVKGWLDLLRDLAQECTKLRHF
jgi:hypothetical protein